MLAGDLDPVLGLITCERGLFSLSAKPATAAGIDAGDPRSRRLQSVGQSRTTLRQAQEVATRHDGGMTGEQTQGFEHTTHMLT